MPDSRDFSTHPLTAAEIRWTLEPLARVEWVDLLMFNESELLAYARGLQEECARLRELTHEAISQLATIATKLAEVNAVVYELRSQLAAQRHRES